MATKQEYDRRAESYAGQCSELWAKTTAPERRKFFASVNWRGLARGASTFSDEILLRMLRQGLPEQDAAELDELLDKAR